MRRTMIQPIWLITAVPLLLVSQVAFANGFTGPVVSVLDGDTLEVLHNRHPERIRSPRLDQF